MIQTDVALLKRDSERFNTVSIRLEDAITRIGELANSVTKMLAVHEQRIAQHDRADEELYKMVDENRAELRDEIKEIHSRITTTCREHTEAIERSESKITTAIQGMRSSFNKDNEELVGRVSALEKWQWKIAGAAAAIPVLFQVIIPILKEILPK